MCTPVAVKAAEELHARSKGYLTSVFAPVCVFIHIHITLETRAYPKLKPPLSALLLRPAQITASARLLDTECGGGLELLNSYFD